MKCKAYKCPFKDFCTLYDPIRIKTIGTHFALNPYFSNNGIVTCYEFIGDELLYLRKQTELLKLN